MQIFDFVKFFVIS